MRKLCDILLISAANLCSHRDFEFCEIISVYCRGSSKSRGMMPPSRPGYTWLVTISAIKCLFATVLCFHLPPFNQVFLLTIRSSTSSFPWHPVGSAIICSLMRSGSGTWRQPGVTRSSQTQAWGSQERSGAARSSREAARGYRPTGIPGRAPLLGVFQKTLRDVLEDVHPS